MLGNIRLLHNISLVRQAVVLLRPRGKAAFVNSLPDAARLLDVGCGNSSPMQIKLRRPDIYYIGLDVEDYNQTAPQEFADEYILAHPEQFSDAIRKLGRTLDAVISAHNIEHCLDPDGTLDAILNTVKPHGRMYLSFPCEASARFPKRKGSLNFHDDTSHRTLPKWDNIIAKLQREGFCIDYSAKRYRPLLPALIGLLLEPIGALTGTNMPIGSTWALYGFESVIWASRSENIPDPLS